ncbi:hypothetical protein GMSM_17980 [Geomonas sp. Red276]
MRRRTIPEKLLSFARDLRSHQTDAEQLLWLLLRNRQLDGFKFRRQHTVGEAIIDYYCAKAAFAIEVDGGQHNEEEKARKDRVRSWLLNEKGILILRFWNHEVLKETTEVLEQIWRTAVERENRPHPPSGHPLS